MAHFSRENIIAPDIFVICEQLVLINYVPLNLIMHHDAYRLKQKRHHIFWHFDKAQKTQKMEDASLKILCDFPSYKINFRILQHIQCSPLKFVTSTEDIIISF